MDAFDGRELYEGLPRVRTKYTHISAMDECINYSAEVRVASTTLNVRTYLVSIGATAVLSYIKRGRPNQVKLCT